jgi:ferrous iron transport protein B
MIASVALVRFIGETLVGYAADPLFELYRPWVMRLDSMLGNGFLHELLIGKIIEGEVDFVQSMGVLTTALYVPVGMVLPYIVAFYVVLAILEDSGYLPRLATLSDSLLHKLGMHGHGILPVFLGLGCNVPGILAARVLETRKQRFIASTLIGISVPCMAQTAMIFGVLGDHGSRYILLVFATLTAVFIVAGFLLKRLVPGDAPEIFLEIPPYRRPSVLAVFKKTWMRVRWFLTEAIPFLFLGVLLVNILFSIGFFRFTGVLLAPVLEGICGLPQEAASALMVGFLRKDLAVGMLLPLNMTPMQLVTAVTMLTVYFPCAATFAVMMKELKLVDTIKASLIMVSVSLLVGGMLNLLSSFF